MTTPYPTSIHLEPEACVSLVSTYTLLRLPAVLKARGRSRSSHYADIKRGLFTRQVDLGVHCVGWPEHEVIALNQARVAGKTEEEVRALVRHLENRRKGTP